MTKDQIIEKQSEIIRELLKIGMERLQEISDLFCAIEKLPKGADRDETPVPVIDRTKVVEMRQPARKSGRICPRCKENERPITPSGKVAPYCRECNAARTKEYNERRKINNTGMSDRDVSAIKALEGNF